MSRRLEEAILEPGVGHTNYFNGRLLTADDLRNDQDVVRERLRRLGRATGGGVAEGLEVSVVSAGSVGDQPVLKVTKGLAVSRSGKALSLPADEHVKLVRRAAGRGDEAGLFAECGTTVSAFTHLENGFYILFVGPASGYSGSAPVRGLGGGADGGRQGAACGSRYEVEGVRFRLAPFDVFGMDPLSQATRRRVAQLADAPGEQSDSMLRNLLAHVCYGTEELAAFHADPLKGFADAAAGGGYGALDYLRGRGETDDCEVPLALVYWRGGTVRFVDGWAVRRRVTRRDAGGCWPPYLGDRAASEREAMLCQFQDHLARLVAEAERPERVVAREYFRYVPPVAVVPLRGARARGFVGKVFLDGVARREPEFINGAVLRSLLREAADYDPADIGAEEARREMLWVYLVAQGEMASDAGAAARPYFVLTSAHVPYRATPRFDAAIWDYATYPSTGGRRG